jgi:lysozyme family protein
MGNIRWNARHNFHQKSQKGLLKLPELALTPKIQQRPHSYNNQGYLPNGGATTGHTGLPPGAAPLLPNNGRIIQTGAVRVLCVADVRGMSDLSIPPMLY